MKRDLKINYGILDGIIEQLHKYKHALDTMESSLAKINEYVKPNQGESIDAWVFTIEESEDYIRAYHEQIQDLLTLFESYVSDTNAYITPLARQSMMQVDRNDIWVNLQQIERGISGNVGKASRVASRVPYNTFSFFDDPTESEIEKSRSNEANLNQIRREINRSESVLQQKMDDLWGIYNTKVKPFENTDDDYYGKAQKLKMSYTGVFEGVWDGVEDLSSDIYGFGKGLVLGLYEIGKGIVTVAGDAGIVYTSHQLPDSIEPDLLKEAADKRVEGYRAAAMQAIKDPMGVAESITQSFSDTYEDEGVAYVAGNVSTAFIPYVGMAGKSASLAKVAGKIPNSNLSKVAGSSKVDVAAIVKKHNAFEGIKRGMGEFVQDVKGGMQIAGNPNRVAFGANGVSGNSLGKVNDVAESGVASVSRSGGSNRAVDNSIVRIKTEVERVDGGKESPPNKSINKQIYEKEMVKALKEQPLYNRKPNKPRNFTSKIRNEDGSTTYTFTSTKNGEEYAVTYDKTGFPIFNSKYEVTLEEKLYLETDAVQFNYASKQLYKEINRNPELANQFNSQEINILEAGRVPQNLTWHHHQIPGKMQIVDYFEHQSASHTGGRAIWGGGEAGRRGEIKKKILERIKWE